MPGREIFIVIHIIFFPVNLRITINYSVIFNLLESFILPFQFFNGSLKRKMRNSFLGPIVSMLFLCNILNSRNFSSRHDIVVKLFTHISPWISAVYNLSYRILPAFVIYLSFLVNSDHNVVKQIIKKFSQPNLTTRARASGGGYYATAEKILSKTIE